MPALRLIVFLALLSVVFAGHTSEEWKTRTIYQLLTDRFGTSDDSSPTCASLGNYCGGSWQGITNHLDYIAGILVYRLCLVNSHSRHGFQCYLAFSCCSQHCWWLSRILGSGLLLS